MALSFRRVRLSLRSSNVLPTRAVLSFALLVVSATPAAAQLGKLKRLGTDAIKEKVVGKDSTASKPTGADAAKAAGVPVPDKKVNYAITAERLDLVSSALQPLLAQAEAIAGAQAASADYGAKKKAAEACMNKAAAGVTQATMMNQSEAQRAKVQQLSKETNALTKRMNAAVQANNMRAARYIQDSLEVSAARASLAAFGGSCDVPYMPAVIIEGQLAQQQRNSDQSSQFDPGAAVRGAMTTNEFGMVRERMALWLLGQESPSMLKGALAKFTPEEQAVLSAKAPALKRYTPLFKDGALTWVTWGDVKHWN